MTTTIRGYFSDIRRHLHLAPSESDEIVRELQTHIEERAQELADSGMSTDESIKQAMREFGETESVANKMYEVHTTGTWKRAGLAALPHLVLSLLFATHLWTRPALVGPMLGIALVMSILGWRKGRPLWSYPWLGYCLIIPLVSWGLAMSAIGYGAWGVVTKGKLPLGIPIYAVSITYIGFSLWVFVRVLSRVSRRDWGMGSLMVLPLPFLGFWFMYFYGRKELLEQTGVGLQEFDGSVATVFLILALTTVAFFRIGRRFVRVALLAITAPSMIVLAWLSRESGPGFIALFLFAALSIVVLFAPALFDRPKDAKASEELRYALPDQS